MSMSLLTEGYANEIKRAIQVERKKQGYILTDRLIAKVFTDDLDMGITFSNIAANLYMSEETLTDFIRIYEKENNMVELSVEITDYDWVLKHNTLSKSPSRSAKFWISFRKVELC